MTNQTLSNIEATEAGAVAFRYLRGATAVPTAYEAKQLEGLARDLTPFTQSVRMQVRGLIIDGATQTFIRFFGDDEGCVNNNHRPLAECWLERASDEPTDLFFYYEA